MVPRLFMLQTAEPGPNDGVDMAIWYRHGNLSVVSIIPLQQVGVPRLPPLWLISTDGLLVRLPIWKEALLWQSQLLAHIRCN